MGIIQIQMINVNNAQTNVKHVQECIPNAHHAK